MDVVAIGTSMFVPGFGLAGVRTVLANADNVMEHLDASKDAAIVIVEGTLLDNLPDDEREAIRSSVSPVIISLSRGGERETQELKRMIKNTLGVDLLQ